MQIQSVVELLCKKYKTRDPYEIASCKRIEVLFESLGCVRGYYNQSYRNKMIHINSNLRSESQRFTCAHELGHALLHPDSNTMYLQTNTLFCINKLENEANYFAVTLLIPDEDLKLYESYSIPEISAMFNINEHLIEYRLKSLHK